MPGNGGGWGQPATFEPAAPQSAIPPKPKNGYNATPCGVAEFFHDRTEQGGPGARTLDRRHRGERAVVWGGGERALSKRIHRQALMGRLKLKRRIKNIIGHLLKLIGREQKKNVTSNLNSLEKGKEGNSRMQMEGKARDRVEGPENSCIMTRGKEGRGGLGSSKNTWGRVGLGPGGFYL